MANISKMFLQYEVMHENEQGFEQNSSDTVVDIFRGNLAVRRQRTSFCKGVDEVNFFDEVIGKRDRTSRVLLLPVFYQRTEKYMNPLICSSKLFREQEELREFIKGGYGIWDVIFVSSDKIPKIFQETGELQSVLSFVNRVMNEDYLLLSTEIDNINHTDARSAFKIADTFERGMNYAKLIAKDPLERRKYEDFQWNLIEIKRKLWILIDGKEDVKKLRKKLEKMVKEVKDKLLACEETKRTLRELGVKREDIFKDFEIKMLPDGRVEYIWKKSG